MKPSLYSMLLTICMPYELYCYILYIERTRMSFEQNILWMSNTSVLSGILIEKIHWNSEYNFLIHNLQKADLSSCLYTDKWSHRFMLFVQFECLLTFVVVVKYRRVTFHSDSSRIIIIIPYHFCLVKKSPYVNQLPWPQRNGVTVFEVFNYVFSSGFCLRRATKKVWEALWFFFSKKFKSRISLYSGIVGGTEHIYRNAHWLG